VLWRSRLLLFLFISQPRKAGVFKEKLEKIKTHVAEHKEAYIVGALGIGGMVVSAVFTTTIMRGRYSNALGVLEPGALGVSGEQVKVQTHPLIFSLFMKDSGNAITTIETGRRGHPGFVTEIIETGEIFPSHNATAKHLGVYPSLISDNIKGKNPDVDGLHFRHIPVF
jgi:hypothetical protein